MCILFEIVISIAVINCTILSHHVISDSDTFINMHTNVILHRYKILCNIVNYPVSVF